ncbi:nuclease-related domain-containing protein [Hyalangium sp.]|uniref:nuclease-related domain-containing protein n=1 Tax=Hyalangium sp. TaxID=2028555 RepID=UPI003899D61E
MGEEFVGRILASLKPLGWTILHDLEFDSDSDIGNVDHLAIGPQGVFVIDTKNVSGLVSVGGYGIAVDGRAKDYVSQVIAQAQEVRERLLQATGRRSLWVQGVLAFVDANMDVTGFPQDVLVVRAENLVSVLQDAPPERTLGRNVLSELVQAAKASRTWT